MRGGSIGKGLDSTSLKLKVAARCGDLKLLAKAMKSYPGAEDLNTRDCALKGLSCLDPPNGSLIYHRTRIATHVDLTK